MFPTCTLYQKWYMRLLRKGAGPEAPEVWFIFLLVGGTGIGLMLLFQEQQGEAQRCHGPQAIGNAAAARLLILQSCTSAANWPIFE